MKKYEFPLQAVLTLRKMKQDQALELYASAVQECTRRRDEVVAAENRADELAALLSQKEGVRFSPGMQQAYIGAWEDAREDIKRAEEILLKAEKQREQKLNAFLESKRKTELLEHLREKQHQEHLREEYRKEELALEDIVIAKCATARSAGATS